MKVHVGADSQTSLVHSTSITAANVHDNHEVANLLHGNETRFYGDSAYRGKAQRERLKEVAPKAKDFTNRRAYRHAPLSAADKQANRRKSSIRAKVEHPFLTLKHWWGFVKVRYRGLAKHANRTFATLAMISLGKWGRPLTGEVVQRERKMRKHPPVFISNGDFQRSNLIAFRHFCSIHPRHRNAQRGLFSASIAC